jgi:DNA recombination protein RmuC
MENVTALRAALAALDPLMLVLAATAVLILVSLAVLIVLIWRNGQDRQHEAAERHAQTRAFETEIAELKGRLLAMAETSSARQAELASAIHERLDRVSHHVGSNLEETSRRTSENLARLNERLAVIDTAQRNITELSTRVVSLQDVLANKQQRGAFGQLRMEAIIEDSLPRDAYDFQFTLSNGKRPDCVIHMPGAQGVLVIDAKFPLEGFEALRTAHEDGARKGAMKLIQTHVGKHIDDIATKYAIPGETQDTMLMFVPSESIYAELHESFPDLLQKAHRARVVIVSPNMMMLAVQTIQAIMKDVRMREQAGIIQREVGVLMVDVNRLKERVLDFQRHFGLLGGDVEKIVISTDKIASRGRKIENLEFEGGQPAGAVIANGSGEALPA